VADFIGRANLVKATVRAHEADRTIVDCGLGTIACHVREIPIGNEATLCIRPEFLRIAQRETAEGANIIEGRVESLVFIGEAYEAEIRIGTERLLARFDTDADLEEGDPVTFGVDPAHCLLISL
jgi:iron(III) transport system ATP-binding protein